MITVIHYEHAKLAAISNLWFARYPDAWRRMLAVANLLDVPLLALIYQRYRELQDAAAREAFTRQEDFSVVAWEWRQQVAEERRQIAVTRDATQFIPCISTKSLESLDRETAGNSLVESVARK